MRGFLIVLLTVSLCVGTIHAQIPVEYRLDVQELQTSMQENYLLQTQVRSESKSVTSAVVLSLLVPGLGHWYANDFSTGKYFVIAEGASWLTFAAFQYRGDWLREDARSYARLHSGAQFDGKNDEFDVNIGNYNSVDEYNEAQLRDRQFSKLYTDPSFSWQWNSNADRSQFRSQRVKSDKMYENAKFVVGALVINRVIAAFSAGRAAARSGSAEAYQGAWQVGATVQGGVQDAHGIEFRLAREF